MGAYQLPASQQVYQLDGSLPVASTMNDRRMFMVIFKKAFVSPLIEQFQNYSIFVVVVVLHIYSPVKAQR